MVEAAAGIAGKAPGENCIDVGLKRERKLLVSIKRIIGVVAVLLGCGLPVQGRTLSILLGDIDGGIYEGAGSVDDVYVDASWRVGIVSAGWPGTSSDFDVARVDNNVPFTFRFSIVPGEIVTAATLKVGLRATHSDVATDEVFLESPTRDGAGSFPFDDLGWLPLSSSVEERSMDLATALGRNLLPQLQDGQLNVFVRDDSLVDYAILDMTIVPEPGVGGVLLLGACRCVSRGKRKR